MGNVAARRHHFVPRFLLEPWSVNGQLTGYQRDGKGPGLRRKTKGTKGFCYQIDLLSLRAHNLGRDALERDFFGSIDSKGAIARERLLVDGPDRLSGDERCDFARLLLSLDVRRPSIVNYLRESGIAHLAAGLNNDPAILQALVAIGANEQPSTLAERLLGAALEDRALALVQRLVDNPVIGRRLINAYWHVLRLGHYNQTLILADRPLIRLHGYDDPRAVWALPLTPRAAFVATNDASILQRLLRLSREQFAKRFNRQSATQAERYAFCVETRHARWLANYLGAPNASLRPHRRAEPGLA